MWRAHEDSKDSRSHSQAHDVSNTSQTRPVTTQVVRSTGSVNKIKIDTVQSEIRLDSEISPGVACESGLLSSPGASRSWSRSRSRPWFGVTI